jgi:hypothetical protein
MTFGRSVTDLEATEVCERACTCSSPREAGLGGTRVLPTVINAGYRDTPQPLEIIRV